MHKHTMHIHVHVHTAIHVVQASTQVLCMYVLTHTCTCACAYRQDIHTTRSCSVFHTYAPRCRPCVLFFEKMLTPPWGYALRMAYVYTTMKLAALRIMRIVTMAGVVTVVTSWTCQSG